MASKKRTWLWVILGVMGTIALLVVVLIGGAIFEVRRHVRSELVENRTAEQEFDRQRARFAGQQPLIESVSDKNGRDDSTIVHRAPADAPHVEIHTLRVLLYTFNEGRLVHVDVPGWLLRRMPRNSNGGFNYSGGFNDDTLTRSRLTIDELERHGLGLVFDGRNRDTRTLIWTE